MKMSCNHFFTILNYFGVEFEAVAACQGRGLQDEENKKLSKFHFSYVKCNLFFFF